MELHHEGLPSERLPSERDLDQRPMLATKELHRAALDAKLGPPWLRNSKLGLQQPRNVKLVPQQPSSSKQVRLVCKG